MATLDVIRRLTLQATTQGVDEAAAKTEKLAGSMDKVAASSVKMDKAQLSAEQTLLRILRTIDPAVKANDNLRRTQEGLDRARQQGLISQREQNNLMQQAAGHFTKASTAAKQHSVVLEEMSHHANALSGEIGSAGRVLSSFGVIGLAVAAALGGMAIAFTEAAKGALELAEKAGKLVDLSDSIGLTTAQIQGLQKAAAEVGVGEEQLTGGLEKFSAKLGELRDNNKGAIESFERLREGLAQQVASATTTREALDLVFKAMSEVDTAARSLAGKELFGKGMIAGAGRLAEEVNKAGGSINDLVKNLNPLDAITRAQAEEWDRLGDAIKKNLDIAKTNIQTSFGGPTLEILDQLAKAFVEITRVVKLVSAPFVDAFGGQIFDAVQRLRVEIDDLSKSLTGLSDNAKLVKIGEFLVGSQTLSQISALIDLLKALIEILQQLAAAIKAVGTLDFTALANAAIAGGRAIEQAQTAISNFGSSLVTVNQPVNQLAATLDQVTTEANKTSTATDKLTESYKGLKTPATTTNDLLGEMEPKMKGVALAAADTGKQIKEKVNPALQELGNVAGQIGSSLVSAFLKGENAAKALKSTLQSVASSATSSAISKLVTGDFTGAAVSGGIAIGSSILSFLFGNDEQDKRNQEEVARQQAEAAALVKRVTEAWAALADELAAFERQAQGLTEGTLRKTIDSVNETTQSFVDTAAAAGSAAGTAEAAAAGLANINRVLTEFFKQIDVAIDQFGGSGTVLQARANVKTLMDDFKSLTDDIIVFGEQTGDAVGTMERLARLQQKGVEGFLNLLDVSEPLSQTRKQFDALQATAIELKTALVELGLTAEDAAAAVNEKLNVAIAKIRGDFLAPLVESINEFVGGGWINDAEALIAQVKQLRTDAVALGLTTATVDIFYTVEAQKIINANQLVGDSFNALVRWLDLGDAGLHEFTAAVEDTTTTIVRSAKEIADAIQANEDRLFNALHRSDSLADQLARFDLAAQREREKEIAAGGEAIVSLEAALAQERLNVINDFLDEQRRAAEQAAEDIKRQNEQIAEENKRLLDDATEFIQSQVRRISDWIANFLAGPTSTLPPSQQLATAQSHFASEMSLAASGNRDALSNITSAAQTLVDATRRYYGSSAAGQSIISNLITQLRGLPSQLTPEEFIVGELKPPIEDIPGSIGDQTTALSALLNNLKLAIQSGDAQAIAVALLPMFDQLDTTMDQALSFAEFQAGLGANYTTGTLRSIFNELDNNGNGLIEKSELIKLATQGTKTSVDVVDTKLATTNDLLNAIKNLNQTNAAQYDALINIVTGISNVYSINASYLPYLATIASWAPGSSHELGGLLSGPRHANGGVPIVAEGGEYIMSRRAVAAFGVGTMDAMNYGSGAANDNIFSAIRGLERSLLRGIKALMETQMEAAGVMAAPMKEANKLSRARRGAKAA